jgi:hypothetical protein
MLREAFARVHGVSDLSGIAFRSRASLQSCLRVDAPASAQCMIGVAIYPMFDASRCAATNPNLLQRHSGTEEE